MPSKQVKSGNPGNGNRSRQKYSNSLNIFQHSVWDVLHVIHRLIESVQSPSGDSANDGRLRFAHACGCWWLKLE